MPNATMNSFFVSFKRSIDIFCLSRAEKKLINNSFHVLLNVLKFEVENYTTRIAFSKYISKLFYFRRFKFSLN